MSCVHAYKVIIIHPSDYVCSCTHCGLFVTVVISHTRRFAVTMAQIKATLLLLSRQLPKTRLAVVLIFILPTLLLILRIGLHSPLHTSVFSHTTNNNRSNNNSNNNSNNSSKRFPSIETVIEMATLSSLIYAFHTEDYGNDDVNNTVCDRINRLVYARNSMRMMQHSHDRHHDNTNNNIKFTTTTDTTINNRTVPPNIHCEWYHHDWIDGTQIMIVSSPPSSIDRPSMITIIFAGTDDMTTSLTDVDVLLSPFGYPTSQIINTTNYPLYNVTLPDPNIRVHTGFDTTLFNTRNLFGEIVTRVEQIRRRMMMAMSTNDQHQATAATVAAATASLSPQLYTTGHSLGGGYSILMAIGLTQYYESLRHDHGNHTTNAPVSVPEEMTVINFGCPQIGNVAFRDYIHTNPSFPSQRLHMYRYVLGWDIVPRLPTLLQHVGHTIQLSTVSKSYMWDEFSSGNTGSGSRSIYKNITTAAYYHHIGNVTLQYSSVPFGWSATPFIWIPGAVTAHYITAYIQCLYDLRQQLIQQQQHRHGMNDTRHENVKNETHFVWITDFERSSSVPISNDTVYDDDYYVEPPNDDTDEVTATLAQH